ncbi:hypothetical protein BaRGS_00037181, partial [Batillaria attramentaria]
MVFALYGTQALLIGILLEIPCIATLGRTDVALEGFTRDNRTTSSVEFPGANRTFTTSSSADSSSNVQTVTFDPNLNLTTEDLLPCFLTEADLTFYASSGDITFRKAFSEEEAADLDIDPMSFHFHCSISLRFPSGMVGYFDVRVCYVSANIYDQGASKFVWKSWGCDRGKLYSTSNDVILRLALSVSGVRRSLNFTMFLRFSAALSSSRPQLELKYNTPLAGYIQTPGWSSGKKYKPNMDSCVTLYSPRSHDIMTSLLAFDLGGSSFSHNLIMTQTEKCKYTESAELLSFSEHRLIHSEAISVRFRSGYFSQHAGFKLTFSFHNQSALPQRLPDGKWNCSVPHWADFQQHFLCTLYPECAGGEDDVVCFSRQDECGLLVVFPKKKCFAYVESNDLSSQLNMSDLPRKISWLEAREVCANRKMRLPSFETEQEHSVFYRVLNVLPDSTMTFYIGLESMTEPLYRRMWRLSSGVIAYNIYVTRDGMDRDHHPPVGGMLYRGMLQDMKAHPVNCMSKQKADIICESTDEQLHSAITGQGETIHLQAPAIGPNAGGVDLIVCPKNHSTHTFLACDVHSDCWLDVDGNCVTPMTPLPPSFQCSDQIERVPYSLVSDYREDCGDGSDEDVPVFQTCLSSDQYLCGNKQTSSTAQPVFQDRTFSGTPLESFSVVSEDFVCKTML